jgi:TIR domain
MIKVFVSHSSDDREFVTGDLRPLLQSHDIEAWCSEADIESAEDWERSIRVGLNTSSWFLVVLTPSAIKSRWVKAEVHWACTNRWGRIISLMLTDCEADRLHLQLPLVQSVDYKLRDETARGKLLNVFGVDPSDADSKAHPKDMFEISRKAPMVSTYLPALQRRAARICDDPMIVGASGQVVSRDEQSSAYKFFSALFPRHCYYYEITPVGERVIKIGTASVGRLSDGDQVQREWWTFEDSTVERLKTLISALYPLDTLDLVYRQSRFEDFDAETDKHRVRRTFFKTRIGDLEVGARRTRLGDTEGYTYFHRRGDGMSYIIDKETGELAVVGAVTQPTF